METETLKHFIIQNNEVLKISQESSNELKINMFFIDLGFYTYSSIFLNCVTIFNTGNIKSLNGLSLYFESKVDVIQLSDSKIHIIKNRKMASQISHVDSNSRCFFNSERDYLTWKLSA